MSISASTKIGEGPLSEQTGVTTHETGKNPSDSKFTQREHE